VNGGMFITMSVLVWEYTLISHADILSSDVNPLR